MFILIGTARRSETKYIEHMEQGYSQKELEDAKVQAKKTDHQI